MSVLDISAAALPAATRSGLLVPTGPSAVLRMARTVLRGTLGPSALLGIAAARWPHRTAIIDDGGALTYDQLDTATAALAVHLRQEYAIGAGSRVGVLCRNGRAFVQAFFAVASLGADVVLINTDFTATALAAALSSHEIRIVLCEDEFHQVLDQVEPPVVPVSPSASGNTGSARPPRVEPGRIVLLTSGTTGTPKGVPRTPNPLQVAGVAATVLGRTKLRTGNRIAVAVPFFHGFGFAFLLMGVALGATVLTRRRFDAETALAQASLHRADALAAVPIMLARILELPDNVRARNPVPRLRVVVAGGAPLDPALGQRFMNAFGEVLYNGYGSSEVGIGSFATPGDLRRAPDTVGRPVAGSPVMILDEGDRRVSAGTIGRIFVGGPLAFDGYTSGAGKSVVADATETGDRGYLDEHGCLYIVGREDDMIVSGGENVYPQTVENALGGHPDVADNAVLGVADVEYGQRLAAFVVARTGSDLDEARLREHLRAQVARYEQPRDICFVTEIPRNPTGKVDRKALRDNATEAQR